MSPVPGFTKTLSGSSICYGTDACLSKAWPVAACRAPLAPLLPSTDLIVAGMLFLFMYTLLWSFVNLIPGPFPRDLSFFTPTEKWLLL